MTTPFAQPSNDYDAHIPGPRDGEAPAYGGYGAAAYFMLVDQVATLRSTEERQAQAQALFPGDGAAYAAFMGLVQINIDKRREDTDARTKQFEEAKYEELKAADKAREKVKREKAERRIGGELSPAAEVFKGKLAEFLLSADALDDMPDPEAIVDGWLYSDSLNWIAGPSGTFKSFVAHDLACRYGRSDLNYHGFQMAHGRALYIVAEGASMFKHRKNAWEGFNGKIVNVDYLPMPVQLSDFEEQMPALIALAKERNYGMVIFDTQAMCTVGQDENTAEGMGIIVNAAHSLREATGGAVILVHHFDKKGESGMRGSGAQYAAASTVIVTKRGKDEMTVTLSTKQSDHGKAKDDEGRDDLTLQLDTYDPADHGKPGRKSLCPNRADEDWTRKPLEIVPDFDPERIEMLAVMRRFELEGGALVSDLAAMINESFPKDGGGTWKSNDARSHAQQLLRKGCAEKKGTRYVLTPLGEKALAKALSVSDSDD